MWSFSMLKPSQLLENTIRVINQVMNYSKTPYWLAFGGLYGIIKNDGVIPDGDFDLCTFYGEDFGKIEKAFRASPARYCMSKAIVSDTDNSKALYCSFGSECGYPHICLSFWYKHDGILYYCHDQHHEVEGVGVPKSGYFFRGVPEACVKEFKLVEWPGISQINKIRVPRFPGLMLDNMYPDWAYKIQKYNVNGNHEINKDRLESYHHGGACSPYEIHVNSMKQFLDDKYIENQLKESKRKWEIKLKT